MKLQHTLSALALGLASLSAQAQTEIQWWHSMTAVNGEWVNDLAKNFNASQKDYKINPVKNYSLYSVDGLLQKQTSNSKGAFADAFAFELESAMDAIVTVDQAGCVVVFNLAASKMFQCPAKEALGQPLDRFILENLEKSQLTPSPQATPAEWRKVLHFTWALDPPLRLERRMHVNLRPWLADKGLSVARAEERIAGDADEVTARAGAAHGEAGDEAADGHGGQREARREIADGRAGQDRMRHGVAEQAHPPQHQEHADRPGAKRQRDVDVCQRIVDTL